MIARDKRQQGFTLIELITVIIVLGVVSVGIGGFIRSGAQIYVDVSERDQLLSQSRFVVERLNRELRNAVPGSARIIRSPANIHCLEFVPIETSVFYSDIPVSPETSTLVSALAFEEDVMPVVSSGTSYVLVYPTNAEDVYDTNEGKRQSFSCVDEGAGECRDGNADNLVQFTVPALFATDSPANRLYIVSKAVSYCLRPASSGDYNIYRYEGFINSLQAAYASGGVLGALMAEGIKNNLSTDETAADNPFRVAGATLTRNAVVYTLLRFGREDEQIVLVNEVHIPNVP